MISDVNSLMSLGAKADPKAVAAKVQGMFLEVMLKAMEDSVDAEDGLFGSGVRSDIYRGMLREHLADALAGQINSPLEGQLGEGRYQLPSGLAPRSDQRRTPLSCRNRHRSAGRDPDSRGR